MITLTPRLHEVLKAIHDYIEEFGKPPYRDNQWIAEKTGYTSNHITNIKSELKKLRYITEDLYLTSVGQEYMRIHFGAFIVRGVDIRVQGEVKASPGDNVFVNFDDFDTPSDETISIPNVSTDKDVFALKVVGPSMQELGILNQDFVIVEKQDSLWWPEPQDVIVARYLPHDPKRNFQDYEDPDNYIGPVVKVYLQRFGESGCELGWKRENETNPYIIQADHLIPIGKVKGVYRKIDTILPLNR